jgi:hypothetical protein
MTSDTQEKPKRKSGRPRLDIDWKMVGEMIEGGAFATHIADRLGIDRDTLYIRCQSDNDMDYSAFAQQKKANGASNIHIAQYELAVKEKNPTMLIWLGKVRCGQKDTDDGSKGSQDQQKRHDDIMEQLKSLQTGSRKIDESNSNADAKSE